MCTGANVFDAAGVIGCHFWCERFTDDHRKPNTTMYLDAMNQNCDISIHEQNFLRQVTLACSEESSSLNPTSVSGEEKKTRRKWPFHHVKTDQFTDSRSQSGVISGCWEKARGRVLLCGILIIFLFIVELCYITSYLAERGDTGEGAPQESQLEAGLLAHLPVHG